MKTYKIRKRYQETMSSAVSAGSTVTLVSFVVPSGTSLFLEDFANYVDDSLAWGSIVWNLFVNGIPVATYQGIKDQIGNQATPRKVAVDTINGGGVFTVTATNNGSVSYNAGCTWTGELRGEA
jgi:hypothetical protein